VDATAARGACREIYRQWRRYLGHDEALDQARGFARRVANENALDEFESAIVEVAKAMAET